MVTWSPRFSSRVEKVPGVLAGDLGAEDDLRVLRAAQAHVAGQQLLEHGPDPAGVVEHQRAGDLDLPHGQLPPAAVVPVRIGQRQRQAAHPGLEEHPHRPGLHQVAQLLQPGRVGGRGEPVGQRGHRDALGEGGAAGDLMTVAPHLDRVRRVAADLDECRPYAPVVDVEVIAGHQPLGAVEPEPRHAVRAVLLGRVEDPLELPGLPDRHHLGLAGLLRGVQVRPDHLQLAVALAEDDPRDLVPVGVPAHRRAERLAVPAQRRGRGDRESPPVQPPGDLTRCLQRRHPAVEIEPVEPVDLQAHVPADDVSQCDRTLRHATLPTTPTVKRMNPPARSRPQNRQPRWSEAEPR